MRSLTRHITDKSFTVLTVVSVIVLVITLVIILGPMLRRGFSAVVFRDTIEFRKMQFDLFHRGRSDQIEAEAAQVRKVRQGVYDLISQFKRGIDPDALSDQAKHIYRRFGQELRFREVTGDEYLRQRSLARDLRNHLQAAFAGHDKAEINKNIDYVLKYRSDPAFSGKAGKEYFTLADEFLASIKSIDLTKRQQYADQLQEVEGILTHLLGPRPGEALPALTMDRYGATRWDMAQRLMDRLLWVDQWVEKDPDQPLVKVRVPRADFFGDTRLEPLFGYMQEHLGEMLRPQQRFYWQYFIDDSTPGHYFGGVGPEILGTLLITLLAMLFACPLGIISAAYLVECASENMFVRVIRICINTLAGVPSIVFGLFGLAFFVMFLVPLFGGPSKPCILTASLTLAVLTLPVMIRASEEAIRSVPRTYKEASLGLGASQFVTFIKVTLPAALPGILTGMILSLSRVAGETAPILFTGAVALGPTPTSIFDQTRTLSYGSYDIAVGDRLAMQVPHNQYGMVVTLVVLILCLNAIAIVLRARISRKLRGH